MLETERDRPTHEVIEDAEARAEVDLDEAIAILAEASASASFAPWGSRALSRLLLRAGRKDEARTYCTRLFTTHPEFVAGWQARLDCCLSRVEYEDIASQILDQLKTNVPQILWLRATLIEVLFAVGQGDIQRVLQNSTNAGIVEANVADRVIALLPILSEIRSTDKGVVEGATAWRYSFCGSDRPVMVRMDDLVHINLSHMRLDGIDDGEQDLALPFHRVCQLMLNALPYHDDAGINSISKVTSQDLILHTHQLSLQILFMLQFMLRQLQLCTTCQQLKSQFIFPLQQLHRSSLAT